MLLNDSISRRLSKADKAKLCDVMKLLQATERYLEKNHRRVKGFQFRCHSICDALAANISDLTVVDGFYLGLQKMPVARPNTTLLPNFMILTCQHSWLLTRDLSIIDPYPVGTLNINPLIFPRTGKYKDYGYSNYLPDERVGKDVRKRWLYIETLRWKSVMRAAHKAFAGKEYV